MSGNDSEAARQQAQQDYQNSPWTQKVEDYQTNNQAARDAYNAELERQRQAADEAFRKQQQGG